MKDNLKVFKSTKIESTFIVDISKAKENPTLVENSQNNHLIDKWLNAKFIEDKGAFSVYETGDYKFLAPKNNPFGIVADIIVKKSPQEFEYMMLGRLRSDCDYFLGYGNRSVRNLSYNTVEEHIAEMKELWMLVKPEWLSMEEILEYEKKML